MLSESNTFPTRVREISSRLSLMIEALHHVEVFRGIFSFHFFFLPLFPLFLSTLFVNVKVYTMRHVKSWQKATNPQGERGREIN